MTIDDAVAVGLHRMLADFARDLHENGETQGEQFLLESVTRGAVETIAATEFCGISLVENGTFTSVAPSDPVASLVDDIQHGVGQGPCLEAAWAEDSVRVDDYENETRWPAFTAAVVAQTPVRSTLSFQLHRSPSTMGALNLYSSRAHAFTDADIDTATAVATHASLALFSARRAHQFATALASRDAIGQAKGMIMERFDIDAVAAWELLRKLSQDSNVRVADLAQQLIDADHPTRTRDLLD